MHKPISEMDEKEIMRKDLASDETLKLQGYTKEDIVEIHRRAEYILEKENRLEEQRKEVKEVVEKLSRFVNNMSCPTKVFVEEVMREHRTLQQSVFSLFVQCIEAWSKTKEGHFDLRNEYTIATSKKIMAAINENWGGRAPLI